MQFEGQLFPGINDEEWQLELDDKEILNPDFPNFSVDLVTGSRWGDHTIISLGAGWNKDGYVKDLLPHIDRAIENIANLVDALNSIERKLVDHRDEIEAQ